MRARPYFLLSRRSDAHAARNNLRASLRSGRLAVTFDELQRKAPSKKEEGDTSGGEEEEEAAAAAESPVVTMVGGNDVEVKGEGTYSPNSPAYPYVQPCIPLSAHLAVFAHSRISHNPIFIAPR